MSNSFGRNMSAHKIPLVALVGLPNAGKSTLLNRLSGTKKAITAHEPHTTRDLNYAEADWEGIYFRLVDTGGLVPDPEDKIQKQIQIRSFAAISEADVLIWVIDRKQNPDTISEQIVRKMWKSGKPFLICINKVDDPNMDKDISDYARLGGFEFVNVSSVNGYGINILLDMLTDKLKSMGFTENFAPEENIQEEFRPKRSRLKTVHKDDQGKYYITREGEGEGSQAGLFQAITQEDGIPDKQVTIKHILLNLDNPEIREFADLMSADYQVYFLAGDTTIPDLAGALNQGDPDQCRRLMSESRLDPLQTVLVDDNLDRVELMRQAGAWGIVYDQDNSDLSFELEQIEYGKSIRIPDTPKILLLGKPNVGKSSLFNAMVGREIQIVTDIPGTTLSVNDLGIRHGQQKYVLLDTTGIRRPGQRTFGAESFATFRTIEAAHRADVILLVLDGSQPLTHQDQVVAGVCKESKKGVVVLANKADLVDMEQRQKFVRDFNFKFNFLKVEKFLWVSAKQHQTQAISKEQEQLLSQENPTDPKTLRRLSKAQTVDLHTVWEAVDEAINQRSLVIDREELRKIFNYLMKKKPPQKLATKKRAVCYDLLYTKSSPPTFELLVKDKTTIHWSYVRFLENLLRRQFRFTATGMVVKLTEIDRRKVLTS